MSFAARIRQSGSPARRTRVLGPWLVDAGAWALGLVAAVFARYDADLVAAPLTATAAAVAVAIVLHTVIGHQQFLYRGRYGFGTFEEVRAVFTTALAVVLVLFAIDLALPSRPVPLSAALVGGPIALIVMFAVRYVRRLQHERRLRPDAQQATPALLFGAGAAGQRLLRSLMQDPNSQYVPVGLIDDDPRKRHLRVNGIAVKGDRNDLRSVLAATGARVVIFAVANVDASIIREVRRRTLDAGAGFKVVPSFSELLDGKVSSADVRDVNIADLLGRHQVDTDLDAIAGYLKGKRVLVTGAGGSIGSELCRQLHRFAPAELMMLDRDESALHAVQLSLHGRALLDSPELILADLRDGDRIAAIFAERRPQVVFHAAALKHLSLLENHPGEAVKSNVWGTQTVLEASAAAGVERFVNISTDKAANPTSVLGFSKRITERLTAHAATTGDGTYLSVRFGNVLGSRGSVLTAFAAQIAAGGPVTVTDPEVTRYFMTVQEAVQLVIQAAAIGRDGEALVLEMGRPVRIAQVARQMAEQADTPVEIVYTGLRYGEKLHEDLFGDGEEDRRPLHPLISHVAVPALNPYEVQILAPYAEPDRIVKELAALCQARPMQTVAAGHIGRQGGPVDLRETVVMRRPHGL
ncbi:dTDP-glucose 4,6-dehydratase [Actinoplanes sp. NBRC 14428]|uniref:FlaA1/EpsC-like NDP-sugar epimerase n=1 Tax=Pseudosporangium ferrugineum TaxID=439699 RepID=A0A2T0RDR1_9ACTN|nr:nucleoside-diphosphate sugar epimerase/dehydratase [Pseudosporangium ferrugineum]PRY19307.1 FlaA1/EpsC-like NDP-sugar epimerase [Pseudosporangium ferrugineum]BCJ54232.1 dTDP-glucose 4,6-dehydratase [Actinoplanes sp. NBRC 14428]